MNVLLISANSEQVNMPAYPLGMDCVAAATRAAGHCVTALDLYCAADLDAAVQDAVRNANPGAVGISVRNIDDQNVISQRFMLDTARNVVLACRAQTSAPIILGGAGYSIYPQAALDYCGADWGVHGEGEVAFPAMVRALETGASPAHIPGVFARGAGCRAPRQLIADLDALPLPDFDLWQHMDDKQSLMLPVQTRRGCALDCSYCSTAAIEGRATRRRSIASALKMLARASQAGFRNIFFTDNIFNLPPHYAKDLCRGILDSGLDIRWQCIYYPWKPDPELVALMHASGCRFVSLGAESGSPPVLQMLHKRFGPDDIRTAADVLKSNGIKVMGFLMLGGPGETRDTALESLAFMDSLGLDMCKLTLGIRIYPHTDVAAQAVAHGLADPDDDLLRPRYYIAPELDTWLRSTIREWAATRAGWMSDLLDP
jgi:hypothetical protein